MAKNFLLMIVLLFSLSSFGAISRQALQEEIGLPLLPDRQSFTRDELENALRKKQLRFRGSAVKRTVFLPGTMVFGVTARELQIISDADDKVEQVDIIFNNKGDTKDGVRSKIRDDASALKKKLIQLLGPRSKAKIGPDGMDAKVWVWHYDSIQLQLEFVRREYTILHIVYVNDADGQNRDGKSDEDVTISSLQKNIVKKDNGDVFISNIPMVDQGSKGYCAVATMERVLIYYGFKNITQHQLADAANTGNGGGTTLMNLISATRNITKKHDFDIKRCGDVSIRMIKRYIDKGAPVLWCMNHNDSYYAIVTKSRSERAACPDLKIWLKSLKNIRVPARGEAHMCMIIGYNENTEEIAVSNSWGDRESAPGWVPLKVAQKVSQRTCCVLVPEK